MTNPTMKKVLCLMTLFAGFALAQMDLSTPNGDSVLVTFESDPMGAEVYVADTFVGTTPTSVRINRDTPTKYRVLIQESDYGIHEGYVEATEDRTVNAYLPRGGTREVTPARPTLTAPPVPADVTPPLLDESFGVISTGDEVWRYVTHNFGESGTVQVECARFEIEEGAMCGYYRWTPELFMSEWDSYTDYGNPVRVTALTSWRVSSDESYSRAYSVAGTRIGVAFTEGFVLVMALDN